MRRLLSSVLFLVATLVAAVPAFAGNGAGLLQYVPSGALVVAGVDVDAIRGSALWERMMTIANANADFQRSLNTLQTDGGFDPRTAIHSVVFASTQVSDSTGDHSIVLIEADFPAEGLARVLTDDGYTAGTTGSVTWYRKGVETVALLGANIVAVGENALVDQAVAAAAGQGSAGPSGTVARQLGAVDKSGAIWMAAQLPAGSQGAQAARLSVHLSSGVRARVDIAMESTDSATEAVTQFNTQIGAVAASPEVVALGLQPVLTGLQAAANETDISLDVAIDEATWTTLIGTLGDLAQEELR